MPLDPVAAALIAVEQNRDQLRGEKGERGELGLTGEQGTQGNRGASGAEGQRGTDGEPGLTWRGMWSRVTSYAPGDCVESEGSSYVATAPSKGQHPPGGGWDLLAKKGEDGIAGMWVSGGGGASVGASGPVDAANVTFTPDGSIAAIDVQAAIQEVRDEGVAMAAVAARAVYGA